MNAFDVNRLLDDAMSAANEAEMLTRDNVCGVTVQPLLKLAEAVQQLVEVVHALQERSSS